MNAPQMPPLGPFWDGPTILGFAALGAGIVLLLAIPNWAWLGLGVFLLGAVTVLVHTARQTYSRYRVYRDLVDEYGKADPS